MSLPGGTPLRYALIWVGCQKDLPPTRTPRRDARPNMDQSTQERVHGRANASKLELVCLFAGCHRLLSVCVCVRVCGRVRAVCMCMYVWVWVCVWVCVHVSVCARVCTRTARTRTSSPGRPTPQRGPRLPWTDTGTTTAAPETRGRCWRAAALSVWCVCVCVGGGSGRCG